MIKTADLTVLLSAAALGADSAVSVVERTATFDAAP